MNYEYKDNLFINYPIKTIRDCPLVIRIKERFINDMRRHCNES